MSAAASWRARASLIRYASSSSTVRGVNGPSLRAIPLLSNQNNISPVQHLISTTVSTFQTHHITTSVPHHNSAALSYNEQDDDTSFRQSSSPPPQTTSTPFILADIGEGISEVELLRWFVSPGSAVSQFDRICEVQSDKASVEITSRFDGVVKRLCGEVGDMMFVGKPLLFIETETGGGGSVGVDTTMEDDVKQTLHSIDNEEDRLTTPTVGSNFSSYYEGDARGGSSSSTEKLMSSPAVRKLCKENSIDLSTILGSGPNGRVLKADVLKLLPRDKGVHPSSNAEVITEAAGTSSSTSTTMQLPTHQSNQDTTIPIRGYNRLMVKSMTSSLQIPHMVYSDEINVNALTITRDSLRPLAKEMGVPKLTYLPFFIKAASLAMKQYPVLNSTIDVEEMTLTYHRRHDVGVAVDTERGLAVPVVRGCEEKSVLEIALELNRVCSLVSIGTRMACILFFVLLHLTISFVSLWSNRQLRATWLRLKLSILPLL